MPATDRAAKPEPAPLRPDPAMEPTIDVVRAGRCIGAGRTRAYELAANGTIPTIRVGRSRRVPTARFLRAFDLA